MKKIIFLFFLLCSPVDIFSIDKSATILGNEKVKGGFTLCTIYHYHYSDGKLLINSKLKRREFKYTINGLRFEVIDYELDGKKFWQRTNYIYDSNDKIIESSYYTADGIFMYKIFYYYNNSGLIDNYALEYQNDDLPSRAIFKYNSDGQLIESISFTALVTKYIYNDKGLLIESTDYLSPPSTCNYRFEYSYDVFGYKKEQIQFHCNDLEFYKRYEYDNFGNLTKIILYNNSKVPISETQYVYSK